MGGFGAPDRGGSREGKKSLRGNKQALQKLVKDEQKGHVKSAPRPTLSEKPPPALPPAPGECALVDAAAQLASRQFDRDQFKVLQRAASSGVGPIISYTSDDSKLEALLRTAKENAGQVYCMVGVHSDNIKRANDRLSPARLEQIKDLALEPSCVAVLAGLAFRDVGIQYAQERALSEQMELAATVGLPLVLYEVRAPEALTERISMFRSSGAGNGRAATTPIAIFNFGGSREVLATYLGLGCYIVLTGRVCDSNERGEQLREVAASIPLDRFLLASDSPFTTPQNIPDIFVREGRNEPSNLPYVLEALAPVLGLPAAELAAATRRNTLTFFGIQEAAEAAAAAAEAVPGMAEPSANGVAVAVGSEPGNPGVAQSQSQCEQQQPCFARRTAKADVLSSVDLALEGAWGKGHLKAAGKCPDKEEEEEEEGEEGTRDGDDGGTGGTGAPRGARTANLFALMRLQKGSDDDGGDVDGDGGGGGGGDAEVEHSDGDDDGEEEDKDEEREEYRAGRSTAAFTSQSAAASRRGAAASVTAAAPRNFVAEAAAAAAASASTAAAAAKGTGATGPRVSYACRSCRSVLFTEADTAAHQDEERALFAAAKPRRKGRGRHVKNSEASLCSMHFLSRPLPWMKTCLQAEGPRVGEGKLVCPTCAAKLGKWAAGPAATGVQCSCGVEVPAPTYAVLRARLDILDAQLDIASAVQSTLRAYEEGGGVKSDGSNSSSSGDEAPGTRKKRQKQRRNKTANFSSFRNKNFGFSLKQQRQLAESVTMAAAEDGGGGGGGSGGGTAGLGAVREDSTSD